MKMISNFVLALGIVGTLGVTTASAASSVTISFDGFCDGMTITTADGLVGGTLSGCLTGFVLGNKSIDYGLIPLNGTTGVLDNVQSTAAGSSEILTYYLDFQNNTWANYGDTGFGVFLINAGTFTVNGKAGSGPASNVKQGNAAVPASLPYSHTATIQFDGFCDGMALNFAGDLVGGSLTGCSVGTAAGNVGTDYAVQPFSADSSGVAANVGSNANGDGNLLVYFLNFANRTWANYYTTNGIPVYLRTGTFTIVSGSKLNPNGPPSSK